MGLVLGGATGDLSAENKNLLNIANKNCLRLVRLINTILDVEKFESGTMDLDVEPIEIMPLVQQTLESNQAYADAFGVTFSITASTPGTFVLANSDWLIQVLTNLLSNAAKFSLTGGRVEVSVSVAGQYMPWR
ncbi:MAG: HAMP domain-containing sensor histidine kinase [Methylobacter sp.]|nr:HAMP domain-containing sensor histidine kinase [Methylobacter sp.]